jgi:RNA binding exosome subunit
MQGKGKGFENETDIIVMKETENRVTEILSTVFSPDNNSDSNQKSEIEINSAKDYFEKEIIDESFFHRKEHEDFLLNFSKRKEEILDLFSKNDAKNFFLQELDERRSRNGLLSSRGFVVMTMIMEVCE